MEILRIEDLTFKYPKASSHALQSVSFSVTEGEFILICGQSGCGKTTLLKLLKRELAPFGEKSGKISFCGKDTEALTDIESASGIGFVMQEPDNQIVTDKVWHELAFGAENIGLAPETIRRRVAETSSFFGISEWFHKNTDELSGGQKQILNLASIMVMQPKLLLLDEPTAQLDPVSAADFLNTLKKINEELGITVIIVEHRPEEVFSFSDRVMIMEKAKILTFDRPENISAELKKASPDHPMSLALPASARIFNALEITDRCPLTVREGRDFLEKHFVSLSRTEPPVRENRAEEKRGVEPAAELNNVWFRYSRDGKDILRGLNLKIEQNEIFCLLGGNGTGKTTALNVIAGLNRAYRGTVKVFGKKINEYKKGSLYKKALAYMPQDPRTLFVKDSVYEDLYDTLVNTGTEKTLIKEKIRTAAKRAGAEDLLDRHPYDVSGGEAQKCALTKILLTEPRIMLIDEPTKGLDAHYKSELSKLLKELKSSGITVLAVTHDAEFAAETADRCGLLFDGELISSDAPQKFFASNFFYTTAANRMARSLFPYAVTCDSVIEMCKGGVL